MTTDAGTASRAQVVRLALPSREALERMVAATPEGVAEGAPALELFRDVYFDTPAGDLEQSGATVSLRLHDDGTRTLTVALRTQVEAGGTITCERISARVEEGEAAELFAGPSAPARRLRALVDPAALEPRLELQTTRRVRTLRPASGPEGELRLVYRAITVRSGEIAGELFLVELELPAAGYGGLDSLLRHYEQEYGARLTLAHPLALARQRIADVERRLLAQQIRSAREVIAVAYHAGRVALCRTAGALHIPAWPGSGEHDVRHGLRAWLGISPRMLRRLGSSPGAGVRPLLEIWLAQTDGGAHHSDADVPSAGEIVWLPLDELLARVGTPALRDVRTLAALHALARAELPPGSAGDGEGAERLPSPDAPPYLVAPPGGSEQELPPDSVLNMELSTLAFNERVLALAEDARIPLLERVRFLAIVGSNLDQFFMKRVAGFKRQLARQSRKRTLDGLSADEQLQAIGVRARMLLARAERVLGESLLPGLAEQDIRILSWAELDEEAREYLRDCYLSDLSAVLTPSVADTRHPFPHVRNLRPTLAVVARLPGSELEHLTVIELPGAFPRFVPLPGGQHFVPLEAIIRHNLPRLLGGMEILSAHLFRVTRSARLSPNERRGVDLLSTVEAEVEQRPFRPVVRLEVEREMPAAVRERLLRELQFEAPSRPGVLTGEDVYEVERLIDLHALREIAGLGLPELRYAPLAHRRPLPAGQPVLEVLREGEVLLEFPRDSFQHSVERFLEEAAEDPQVLAIKITLYRTSTSSRIIRLLHRARRNGKEVAAVIELLASFDERRNIGWARSLTRAGIQVIYGLPRRKVHAKLALVVRREEGGFRPYVYIGTGNLNAATAAAYTDLALLSADLALGTEVSHVFHLLTGYAGQREYRQLLVAPLNLRKRFVERIEREIEHVRAGRGGRIRAKLNGLADRGMMATLYRAAQAGVRIDLVVRGLCALRPGVPGLSENIRVVSLLGRFLEHSRIFHFENAGDSEYFVGSADWRGRNLSRRLEVVTPVRRREHQAELDRILTANLSDPEAWELQPDGSYVRASDMVLPSPGLPLFAQRRESGDASDDSICAGAAR